MFAFIFFSTSVKSWSLLEDNPEPTQVLFIIEKITTCKYYFDVVKGSIEILPTQCFVFYF